MYQKKAVLCSATALLAVAVACSQAPQSPASPSGTPPVNEAAAADGSTLKVTAPAPQSPINNAQPQTLALVAGVSTPLYQVPSMPALTYEFQILTTGGSVLDACTTTASPSGSSVTATPNCSLSFDTAYKWRARARVGSAAGPWGEATFVSPIGGFFRGNEVYDPLYNGTTVGVAQGVTFIPNVGMRLNSHDSRVTYALPTNLQQGEFSLMITGIDEGSPGDKTKVMTMQEGTGDITGNDYRMTVEKRGRSYTTPGAVTWRIIMGDADEHNGRIIDGTRIGIEFSDEKWYFWKFTWGTGRAALEVREGGPRGRVIYASDRGTGGFAYRPVPHYVYLGSPIGRGGPIDASIPGAVYKNVWLSDKPRPNFPGE